MHAEYDPDEKQNDICCCFSYTKAPWDRKGILVVMEQFCILMAVVVTGLYTWGKVHIHTHKHNWRNMGKVWSLY